MSYTIQDYDQARQDAKENQEEFFRAAKALDLKTMEACQRKGASLLARESDMTPLLWAVALVDWKSQNPENRQMKTKALRWLIDRSDINALDKDGDSALIITAKRLDPDTMRLLLTHPSIDVNIDGWHGCALKMVAGRSPECEALLGLRVDLLAKDKSGKGPLDWARDAKAHALCELLVSRYEKIRLKEKPFA